MIEIIPNWHPIFVHFAVALLIIATLFHIIAALNSKSTTYYQFENVANWNLWLGAVFAVITAVAGWFAYNSVDHDAPSHLAMTDHRNWALGTTVLFLVLAIWSFRRAKKSIAISWLVTVPLIAASASLSVTAWKGSELVYRHGLGVMALPNTGAHDHASHDHGSQDHGSQDHGSQDHGAQDHAAHDHSTDHPAPDAQSTMMPENAGKEAEQEVGEKAGLHEQDTGSPQEKAQAADTSPAAEKDHSHDHDHKNHTH